MDQIIAWRREMGTQHSIRTDTGNSEPPEIEIYFVFKHTKTIANTTDGAVLQRNFK